MFGFDTAVISCAELAIQRTWSTGGVMHGLAISSAQWGTRISAIFGGQPSDRFDRMPTLVLIGSIGCVMSPAAVAYGFANASCALVTPFIFLFFAGMMVETRGRSLEGLSVELAAN